MPLILASSCESREKIQGDTSEGRAKHRPRLDSKAEFLPHVVPQCNRNHPARTLDGAASPEPNRERGAHSSRDSMHSNCIPFEA